MFAVLRKIVTRGFEERKGVLRNEKGAPHAVADECRGRRNTDHADCRQVHARFVKYTGLGGGGLREGRHDETARLISAAGGGVNVRRHAAATGHELSRFDCRERAGNARLVGRDDGP